MIEDIVLPRGSETGSGGRVGLGSECSDCRRAEVWSVVECLEFIQLGLKKPAILIMVEHLHFISPVFLL